MKQKILVLALLLGLASPAFAQQTVVGTVTRVDVNSYMEQIRIPKKECQLIEVPIYQEGRQNPEGAIIGGIIGGVIGNQIGKGSGNDVATGVGAITGAIIGGKGNQEIVGYRQVEKCYESYTVEHQEKIKNYTVFWSWNGFKGQFYSNRSYKTGDSVNLYVNINPSR